MSDSDPFSFEVTPTMVGERIDKLVTAHGPRLSRSHLRRLFAEGRVVVVSGERRRRVKKGERAPAGAFIELALSAAEQQGGATPDPALELDVVLERADVVVVDKRAGVPSVPLYPGETGTVAGGLVARYPEMATLGFSPLEPGLCHRLDTGTSGLLLAARTPQAFAELSAALKAGQVHKRYLLLCSPPPSAREGTIQLALTQDSRDRRRVHACLDADEALRLGARAATTRYRLLRAGAGRALVEANASPALRHQLRAHFAAVGSPLCGDSLYGGDASLARHALHASAIRYAGGREVQPFDVESPLPAELAALAP
jgi:23S rRNA pseudouridine1911/1915/1917 synthase